MKDYIKKYFKFLVDFYKYLKQIPTRGKVFKILHNKDEVWLEIGAGYKKGRKGWVTLDMNDSCDLYWDLRRGIPFPDNSLDKIYSSHFFEHLTYKQAQILLKDCIRALKDGGLFSICVPNARMYIEAYMNEEVLDDAVHFTHASAYDNTTMIDYINYVAYMDDNHKYMFDDKNIIKILSDIGFKNVELRAFDPSLDHTDRMHESIYAQAYK